MSVTDSERSITGQAHGHWGFVDPLGRSTYIVQNPGTPLAIGTIMHLASPFWLGLLFLVPLLIWRHRRPSPISVVHPDLRLFTGQSARASWLARHGVFSLRLISLVALIVALAGPRRPDLRTRLDTEGVAIMLALDHSGSMSERDFDRGGEKVSRLDAVRRLLPLFLMGGDLDGVHFEGRPADLLGLIRFAARPEVACPLTLQHEALIRHLDGAADEVDPGTNLTDAIVLGLARLQSAGPRRKVLVLLTDGEDNEQRPRSGWTTSQVAGLAKTLGIVIHTIDAGPDRGESPDALRLLARHTLEELAQATGGESLAARDAAGLARAWGRIDRLERSPITSYQYRRYHEAYPWFALAAFVFFGAAELLDRTLWRRIP